MTYEIYEISMLVFALLFVILMVVTFGHAILYVDSTKRTPNNTKHKKISLGLMMTLVVSVIVMLVSVVELPEYAGLVECKQFLGTVTLQNDIVGTKTEIDSRTYCRYLYEDGWSNWKYPR